MVRTLPQSPPCGGASPLWEGAEGCGGDFRGLPRRFAPRNDVKILGPRNDVKIFEPRDDVVFFGALQ